MKCNDVEFRQRRSYYGCKIILWTEMIISARHPADAIVHDCLYFQKVTLSTSFVLGILLSEATLTPLFVFIKGHFYCPRASTEIKADWAWEPLHRLPGLAWRQRAAAEAWLRAMAFSTCPEHHLPCVAQTHGGKVANGSIRTALLSEHLLSVLLTCSFCRSPLCT